MTYKTHNSDRAVEAVTAALREGMVNNRKREPFSFQPLPPDAIRVIMKPTYRGLIEDKLEANRAREEILLPAIARGEPVEINLEEGEIIAHSCAHALLFGLVRQAGDEAKHLIHVRARTRQIKDVIRLIGYTALQSMEKS